MTSKEEPSAEVDKEGDEGVSSQSWASWSSWGQGVLKNFAEKSSSTLGMVKKDLAEFYSTIQHDTVTVVAETATKVQEQLAEDEEEEGASSLKTVKQGFSTALTKFSDSIKHLAEAGAQTTFMIDDRKDRGSTVTEYDRKEAIIYAIRTNPGTFCNEPEGPFDAFNTWLVTFDIEKHRGEISDLLVDNTDIRAMYIKLVPTVVAHVTFWQRYYYKLHLVEQDEIRRAALVARASAERHREDSYSWSDDDDDPSVSEDAKNASLDHTYNAKHAEEVHTDELSVSAKNSESKDSSDTYSLNENRKDILVAENKSMIKPKTNEEHLETPQNCPPPGKESSEMLDKTNNYDPKEGNSEIKRDTLMSELEKPCNEKEKLTTKSKLQVTGSETTVAEHQVENAQYSSQNSGIEEVDNAKVNEDKLVSKVYPPSEEEAVEVSSKKQDDNTNDEDSDLDFDIDDDDEDINEEELAKMISKIKADPLTGEDADDDWESW